MRGGSYQAEEVCTDFGFQVSVKCSSRAGTYGACTQHILLVLLLVNNILREVKKGDRRAHTQNQIPRNVQKKNIYLEVLGYSRFLLPGQQHKAGLYIILPLLRCMLPCHHCRMRITVTSKLFVPLGAVGGTMALLALGLVLVYLQFLEGLLLLRNVVNHGGDVPVFGQVRQPQIVGIYNRVRNRGSLCSVLRSAYMLWLCRVA